LPTIVFYVSGHGFGHASRGIEVINALLARRPELHIIVRTTAPRWLFDLTVRGAVAYEPVETDTGVVQIDSLHLDEAETVRRARQFLATLDERVAVEAAYLEREQPLLVVADIPPLGLAAAERLRIPAVALGNFTWEWIYSAYAGAEDVVQQIGRIYAHADVALRLPMHGGFGTIPHVEDLPFIARRSERDPALTRRLLGLPARARLALVSFGGYGLRGIDLDALAHLDGYVAVFSGSVPLGRHAAAHPPGQHGSLFVLDERSMYASDTRYEDLVRAVDVVVTKPGYGIIAECLANDTAMLYTSRGHFVEYDVLVAEMPRFLRTAFIDHADLFAGRWKAHLDALLAQPAPPDRPAYDGADVAAERLLGMI
jgi:L-arabinokinase